MHVYILLDRSGSMEGIWDESLSSINKYVKDLPRPTKVTLAVFDHYGGTSNYDVLRDRVSVKGWKNLSRSEVSPRGGTPLYDAAGQMLSQMFEDDCRKAVLVVMTDGFENSSKEYKLVDVKAKLDKAKENDWGIVFLGAEFDKIEMVSGALGISPSWSINTTKHSLMDTYTSVSYKTTAYFNAPRGASAEAMAFTDEEKAKASK